MKDDTKDKAIKWLNIIDLMNVNPHLMSEHDFLQLPGLGKKTLNTIKEMLQLDCPECRGLVLDGHCFNCEASK